MRDRIISRKKSWFYSPWVAIVLVIFVVIGGISTVRAFAKERESRAMRNQYARELQELETKESELDHQIKDLSTERGVEFEVRERYRVVKPGEQLVVVVDNGKQDDTSEKLNWWQKVMRFVGL